MKTKQFQEIIENWYALNKRDLPWRDVGNPYLIWVSEIILQQTRINQGHDYYLRFTARFPEVASLAAASEDEVLKEWEGLGYYSRARNLHAAAKSIVAQGGFPTTYEGVRSLKGIGDYTAAAICSFAFGMPVATIDGNVYRVLSRVFGLDAPIDTTQGKREFKKLADSLLDVNHPADYNQALMDFGAMQCCPSSPKCISCPLHEFCVAYNGDVVNLLPVKSKKIASRHRFFIYVLVTKDDSLLIHRRRKGDIWAGLYEPYLLERENADEAAFPDSPFIVECLQTGATLKLLAQDVKHVLTHRVIHADFYTLDIKALPDGESLRLPEDYLFVAYENLNRYAFSVLTTKTAGRLFPF